MNNLPARIDPDEAAIGRPTATARRLVEASVSENTRRAYARAGHAPVGRLAGPQLHPGRPAAGAAASLHAGPGGDPLQP